MLTLPWASLIMVGLIVQIQPRALVWLGRLKYLTGTGRIALVERRYLEIRVASERRNSMWWLSLIR